MTEKEELKVQKDLERSFKMGYTKALYEEGFSAGSIAKRLGVSQSAVRAWIKKIFDMK